VATVFCFIGVANLFLGDRLYNSSPYAIGPLSVCPVLSVCLSCLSVTLVYCGQTVGRIKMKLGMQVGLGPGHDVLDGTTSPPQRGTAPQFSAHICCSQMAGWIKVPLRRKVGLDPSDIVLDGDPAHPPQKSPQFLAHVYCGQTAAWIKMSLSLSMEVGLGPGHIVLDGDPAPSPKRGHNTSPQFAAHVCCGQRVDLVGW